MTRLAMLAGLALATVFLAGCSGGYYVDAAHMRQSRVATADDPPRRRVSSRAWRTKTARATTTQTDATAGAGKMGSGDLGTSPKRGTPEWERAEARAREQEKRVNDAIRSICRGR
jgi:hypothetical protein